LAVAELPGGIQYPTYPLMVGVEPANPRPPDSISLKGIELPSTRTKLGTGNWTGLGAAPPVNKLNPPATERTASSTVVVSPVRRFRSTGAVPPPSATTRNASDDAAGSP